MYKKLLLSVIIATSYSATTITSEPSFFATYIQPCAAATWNAVNPTFTLGLAYILGIVSQHKSLTTDEMRPLAKTLAIATAGSVIFNKLIAQGGKWLHNKNCNWEAATDNKPAVCKCPISKTGLCASTTHEKDKLNALGVHLYNNASYLAFAATVGALYGYSRLSQ